MGILESGFLRCKECGRVKEITKEWVEEVCKKYWNSRTPLVLYDTDLKRFKCSNCQSKQIEYCENIRPKETSSEPDNSSGLQIRYSRMHGHYGRTIRKE